MQPVPECLKAFGVTRVSDVIGGILEVELIYYTPTPRELPREDEDATHRKVYLCLLIQGVRVEMISHNENGGADSVTWDDEYEWYTKLIVSPVEIPAIQSDEQNYTIVALQCQHTGAWTLVFPETKLAANIFRDRTQGKGYDGEYCQRIADNEGKTHLGGSVKFIPRPR